MALRAFLFSSDGTATSELCQILTDLEIEAEVCSEMLVAVERITSQAFDALIVDWDLQTEAMFLIKSVRGLKSAAHLLTLAMVKDDAALPEALQAGANSAIRKPIDAKQAHDTLSTAKQLIAAHHTEKRAQAERLAAVHAATESDDSSTDEYQPVPQDEDNRPKSGFLQQTAPRSAFEAEESKPEALPEEAPAPPPAPDPDARARALRILGYGPQVPDPPKPESSRPSPRVIDFSGSRPGAPRDSAGVFSSFPDPPETEDSETIPAGRPKYGLYAAVAALLVAGGLWMFAPKAKYVASVKNFAQRLAHSAAKVTTASNPDNISVPDLDPEPISGKPTVSVTPDPEIVDAEDDAAAKVQVIESKPIPAPGTQQPPPDSSQPDLSTGQSPVASQSAEAAQALSQPQGQALIRPPSANSALQPTIQPVSAQPASASAPPSPEPSVGQPVAVPATTAPAPASHVPEEGFSANLAPHAAVVIPDSLKTTPAPAPASNLEPPMVPEEVSRAFVIKRVDPLYPPVAVQQRLDGLVVLQAHVAKDGSIRDLKLIKGYFVLGRAAFEAVKQWRFRPYTMNGKPTEFQTFVTVSFKLPG